MLLKEVLFFETSFDLICHEDRGSFREGGLRRCHLSRTALAGATWHLYMCAVGWGEEQALRRLRGTRCGGSPPGGVSVPREGPGLFRGVRCCRSGCAGQRVEGWCATLLVRFASAKVGRTGGGEKLFCAEYQYFNFSKVSIRSFEKWRWQ